MQGGWSLGWINLTFVTDLNEARDYLSRCQSKKLSWLEHCFTLKLSAWYEKLSILAYLVLHVTFLI
jgi:hypothetical protein